jgi:hypothetical protein
VSWARLQPTDVVTVLDDAGQTYRMRIVRATTEGNMQRYEAVLDDDGVLVASAPSDQGPPPNNQVEALADTLMYPLDIPILRDDDNGPGYYVAARGTTQNWPGAAVFSSRDDVEFSQVAIVSESAVMGTCTTTLGNWDGGWTTDTRNTVTVNVGRGELNSATRAAFLADETVNAIMIGAEAVRFQTAELLSAEPNLYRLSSLLRGQRGTEWAIPGHGANERCTLLSERGLRRVQTLQSDVGQQRWLKGVTSGRSLTTATSQTFTNQDIGQQPLSPVDLRLERLTSGEFRFTWKRRTRYKTALVSPAGIDAPLDQNPESYSVLLYGTPDYTVPLLAFNTSEPSLQLTIAQTQTATFPNGIFYTQVRERSAATGNQGRFTRQALVPPSVDLTEVPPALEGQTIIRAFFWYDTATNSSSFAFSQPDWFGPGGITQTTVAAGAVQPTENNRWLASIQQTQWSALPIRLFASDTYSAATPTEIAISPALQIAGSAYDAVEDEFIVLGRPTTFANWVEYRIDADGAVSSTTTATVDGGASGGMIGAALLFYYDSRWRMFESANGFSRYWIRDVSASNWVTRPVDTFYSDATRQIFSTRLVGAQQIGGALIVLGAINQFISADNIVHYADVWRSTDALTFTRIAQVFLNTAGGMIAQSPNVDTLLSRPNLDNQLLIVGGRLLYYFRPSQSSAAYVMRSSADGLTWTVHQVVTPTLATPGAFVATGDGSRIMASSILDAGFSTARAILLTSADGITFTEVPNADVWTTGYADQPGDFIPIAQNVASDLRVPIAATKTRVLFERRLIEDV